MKTELKIVFPNEDMRCLFTTWFREGLGETEFCKVVEEVNGSCALQTSYLPETEAVGPSRKRHFNEIHFNDSLDPSLEAGTDVPADPDAKPPQIETGEDKVNKMYREREHIEQLLRIKRGEV